MSNNIVTRLRDYLDDTAEDFSIPDFLLQRKNFAKINFSA